MKEKIIERKDAGQRLDKYLNKLLPEAGTSFIYKMLRKKNIVLNGKKAGGNEKLNEDDTVRLYFSDETYEKLSGHNTAVINDKNNTDVKNRKNHALPKIIYEDADILFMHKPAGMLSVPDGSKNESANDILKLYCEERYGRQDTYSPSVCNRLDRNTEGLLMCAKTYAASRFFDECIKRHFVRKYYLALCEGEIKEELILDGYIKKDERSNKVKVVSSGDESRHIKTRIVPLEYSDGHSLLMVELISGKSHQIRAHLASVGHPLAGDIKYGGHPYRGLKHQALAAVRLEFEKVLPEDLPENIRDIHAALLKSIPSGHVSVLPEFAIRLQINYNTS